MSDYAINILKAIETGGTDEMNTAFRDAMQAKISDALDAKKIEVAKSIYGGEESSEEPVESDDSLEAETASDTNGTEEV